jgi:hypothetical protein
MFVLRNVTPCVLVVSHQHYYGLSPALMVKFFGTSYFDPSPYIIRTNLMHYLASIYFVIQLLQVSGMLLPIIKRCHGMYTSSILRRPTDCQLKRLARTNCCTGRFIMFSAITNIYNKKTKGPTLMELFTATGKLKKFFFHN